MIESARFLYIVYIKHMRKIIGLKELRQKMDVYARRIETGESFIVMKKSKPIFTIGPIEFGEQLETIVDFSKLRKGGVSLSDVLKRL